MKIKCIKLLPAVAFIICSLFACKKDNNSDSDYARPVVQGYLVPGEAIKVEVYYQKYLEDTITYGYPITGLKLNISDGTNTITLTESKEGTYTYANTSFVADKKTYTLNFAYNDQTISAQTTVPDKPIGFTASNTEQYVPVMTASDPETFVPVTFNWINTNTSYYLMAFKNTETNPDQLSSRNFRAYHDSEELVGQVSTWATRQMTFTHKGNYRIKLFHINKEYSDALNNSGGSSLNLTTPYTNVVNGLGIFTAMQADSLNLKVYQ